MRDLNHLSEIFHSYDTYIIDLWGVMHDGISLNSKAIEVVENLSANSKKNCIFLHCLPRGKEVEEDVFLSKKSKVWQQALNRVHVQKSILLYCFGKLR